VSASISWPKSIQEATFAAELNKICDFVKEHTGVVFEKGRNFAREKGKFRQGTPHR
jgi:hypothetical protein